MSAVTLAYNVKMQIIRVPLHCLFSKWDQICSCVLDVIVIAYLAASTKNYWWEWLLAVFKMQNL